MRTRPTPFEEVEQLFERMSRQFDGGSRWGSGGGFDHEEMPIDLVEHDAEFVVTVDLPGFEKADVDVSVTDHTLRIEAEHEETTDERSDQYLRHERRHDSLHRAIRLPEAVDKARVEARMQNGVLTVTVPKLEVDEVRTIDVA